MLPDLEKSRQRIKCRLLIWQRQEVEVSEKTLLVFRKCHMEKIRYVTDEKGRRVAVQIPLEQRKLIKPELV